MYEPPYDLTTLVWMLLDASFFMWMSIILGFFVDGLIPDTHPEESYVVSFFWITVQILVDILIIYAINIIYTSLVKRDINRYYGLDMFTVIFFLVQTQLFNRLDIIYQRSMRRSLINL